MRSQMAGHRLCELQRQARAAAVISDPRGRRDAANAATKGPVSKRRSLLTPSREPVQPATAEGPVTWAKFPRRMRCAPQAVATSCWPLLPQALPHIPIVTAVSLPLPGLSEQVSPNQPLLSPLLAWAENRCLRAAHMQR